jgi:hypothetical protein
MTHLFQLEKKKKKKNLMLGSSSFFQKKEQVGKKAWIFGSLMTKWLSSSVKELVFTHKCGSQKNNWKGQ